MGTFIEEAAEKELAELVAWKKRCDKMQVETIAAIANLQSAQKTTLEGCEILMQTDTQLSIRMDDLDRRIDIVNKRLRRLEAAIQRVMPR